MIKVVAKCVLKPEHIDTFKSITAPLVEATRAHDNPITYELFQDLNKPHEFLFVEAWESVDMLNAHMEAPHCKEIFPKMEETYAEAIQVNVMELVK